MVKENEKIERYYNGLLQLSDEEKQQYWDALKRELPNSFRFCGSKGYAPLIAIPSDIVTSRANSSLAMPSPSKDFSRLDISPRSRI